MIGNMNDDILTVREAADALRCSQSLVYRLYGEGCLKGFRLGKAGIRLYKNGLESYQQKMANQPSPELQPVMTNPKKRTKTGPVVLDPAFLRHFQL